MRPILRHIKRHAKKDPRIIVLPEPEDPRVMQAIKIILKKKLARPILLGQEKKLDKLANTYRVNLNHKHLSLMNPNHVLPAYVDELVRLRKRKGMTTTKANRLLRDKNYLGTMMVHMKDAEGMVSGSFSTTAATLRPALQIIKTEERFHKVSGVYLMLLENRLLLFADCAVIPNPTAHDLVEIAVDTAQTATLLGIKPKIALLSFSTHGSAGHPMLKKVIAATQQLKKRYPRLLVDGELQVDAALVPWIAKQKSPRSKIQGDANILIFPDLNAANIAYKLVERLAKAKAIGPILQGLRKPVNDLSRGCSVDDIVNLVAITVVQAQGKTILP